MASKKMGVTKRNGYTLTHRKLIKERYGENMLFEKEYREAEEKLYKKSYHVCNMVYDNTLYELYNKDNVVVIDNLSLAQLIDLSNLL